MAKEKLDPTLVRTATAVIVGAMPAILNTTMISVALPTLVTTLQAPIDVVQWVSTGYLLALFGTIPLAGWAQNRFGGKQLWIAGLVGFLVASILCALAWDVTSLIVFRVLQGMAGGVIMPLLTTLIMQAAGGKNLGRTMSTISVPASLGPILGPVVGGLLLWAAGWPWLFWLNVPFGVIGIVLAIRMIPTTRPGPRKRLDVVGLVLLSPAAVGVIYGLTNITREGGFSRPDVYGPVVGGMVLLVGFIIWARVRKAKALLDLRVLRHRGAASSTALQFLTGIVLYGVMLLLPLYFRGAHGYDALAIGLLLIPQGVGALLSRGFAGNLVDRIGPRRVAAVGFAVVAVTTIPFAFASADTHLGLLLGTLLLRGFGLGAVTIPVTSAAYVGLGKAQIPDASIINRTSQQLGGSFGTAVLAVVVQAGLVARPGDIIAALGASFWWAVGFSALAAVASFLLPGRPHPEPESPVAGRAPTLAPDASG